MIIRPACAALALLLAAGCATPENTGIPEPTPAPESAGAEKADGAGTGEAGADGMAGASAGEGAAGEGADGSNDVAAAEGDAATAGDMPAVPPGTEIGPDGEPMQKTITGADPKLEGNDPAWKSGQSATKLAKKADPAADTGPLGNPARDGKAHRYELRAYGTNIEVYMDGEAVPADRVRMHENQVAVVDGNGTVIERLDLPANWTSDSQHTTTPDATDPYDFRDVKGTKLVPPKVMLGGRLVDPPNAVFKHLADRGVKRDRVSMITNVIPQLPLAQAGLENDDIVLAVNEVPDADPGTIRAVLRTMKPGESVDLRILRGSEVLDARVTVAAWDPKHMVRPMGAGGATPTAGAAAGTAAANTTPEQTVAALEEQLAMAKAKIAALERQLNEKDPARKAIRPQPIPAPTASKATKAKPKTGG